MTKTTIFVTVGTTEFSQLVNVLVQPEIIKSFHTYGYTKLLIQQGKGTLKLSVEELMKITKDAPGFEIEVYDLKKSLDQDMKDASLIISHGGTGCLSEALHLNKKVICVINESLMGNHQEEYAEELSKRE